jgi:hypothetical protein
MILEDTNQGMHMLSKEDTGKGCKIVNFNVPVEHAQGETNHAQIITCRMFAKCPNDEHCTIYRLFRGTKVINFNIASIMLPYTYRNQFFRPVLYLS